MTARPSSQTQLEQSHADTMTCLGAWLFRRRTVLPVPIALAIVLIPASPAQRGAFAGAPLLAAILAFEYHAIVRWEERLLEERLGAPYSAYAAQVPRWMPRGFRVQLPSAGSAAVPVFPWRATFYSERGTLIAIAIGFAL